MRNPDSHRSDKQICPVSRLIWQSYIGTTAQVVKDRREVRGSSMDKVKEVDAECIYEERSSEPKRRGSHWICTCTRSLHQR